VEIKTNIMETKWGKTQKIEYGQGERRHKRAQCRRIEMKVVFVIKPAQVAKSVNDL
jgi:hypothetical protein